MVRTTQKMFISTLNYPFLVWALPRFKIRSRFKVNMWLEGGGGLAIFIGTLLSTHSHGFRLWSYVNNKKKLWVC